MPKYKGIEMSQDLYNRLTFYGVEQQGKRDLHLALLQYWGMPNTPRTRDAMKGDIVSILGNSQRGQTFYRPARQSGTSIRAYDKLWGFSETYGILGQLKRNEQWERVAECEMLRDVLGIAAEDLNKIIRKVPDTFNNQLLMYVTEYSREWEK